MKENKQKEIVEFIGSTSFADFGPTLLLEKLEEIKEIICSKETMSQIMVEEWKPCS